MNQARIQLMKRVFQALGAGFFMLVLFSPAYADDVGTVITNMDGSDKYMPKTIELIAYLMGLFALYSGITALKETSQEPGKKPIKPAIVRLVAAAALIALPRTVIVVTNSFGSDLKSAPTLAPTTLMRGL